MSAVRGNETLQHVVDTCVRCGNCLADCDLLEHLGMMPAEIAQVVSQGQAPPELVATIQRCDLCGRCGGDCSADLNPADMFLAARQVLVENGTISPMSYDVMLVHRDWHFFTIYRATYGIQYDDLGEDRFDTLFFPGCTLATYAPELTRAAFAWLKERGYRMGFSDMCCGKPLESIGLSDDADRSLHRLRRQLETAGARRLVTSCPNCEATLKRHLPNVETISIYGLMVDAGIRVSGPETLTIHDSCPDRCNAKNTRDVRALLAGHGQVEMASHGESTICCGSGGIVSMVDPHLCRTRAQRRLAEFHASGAHVCVTSCMACSHRLARAAQAGQVRHCLEMVFGLPVNYRQVERKTRLMWQGRQGEINVQRVANARVLVDSTEDRW